MAFSAQLAITAPTDTDSGQILQELHKALLHLPYRFVTSNALMKMQAQKMGVTLQEFLDRNRREPERNHAQWVAEALGIFSQQNWVVCKSPIAHVYMPRAMKVLLKRSLDARAECRARDRHTGDVAAMRQEIIAHDELDNGRFELQYPGCLWEEKEFDYILDTERMSPSTAVGHLLEAHNEWQRWFNMQPDCTVVQHPCLL
jgi:cytidylate kinase